jgi:pimeloyl-ACP methyl ester carboxylesterase
LFIQSKHSIFNNQYSIFKGHIKKISPMNKEINIEGKKIHYRITGRGKTVMLVHGFGETGDVWSNQAEYFKHKVKLIIPDLPGSGRSDLIPDMSMEGMAAVLKAIIDQEEPGQPGGTLIMIGHSMGGYITLAFAEKYSQYLKAFGLFHSTAYADSEEKKDARRKGIVFIREHGAFEFLKSTTPNLFSPLSKAENQAFIDAFIQSLNNFSVESLVSYYEAMISRPDRTAVLKNGRIPILFIVGKYDTAVPPEDGVKLGSLPEISYIHNLRKSGHMGMVEEADLSNEILEKFFDGAWIF